MRGSVLVVAAELVDVLLLEDAQDPIVADRTAVPVLVVEVGELPHVELGGLGVAEVAERQTEGLDDVVAVVGGVVHFDGELVLAGDHDVLDAVHGAERQDDLPEAEVAGVVDDHVADCLEHDRVAVVGRDTAHLGAEGRQSAGQRSADGEDDHTGHPEGVNGDLSGLLVAELGHGIASLRESWMDWVQL